MQHISTIAALALILGACSQTAEPETTVVVPASTTTVEPATSTSTTRPETTSTTAAPSTTVKEPVIPYPDTSGDDWFKIVSELESFGGWLFENPSMALLGSVTEPGSAFETTAGLRLQEYVDNGWRDLPGGRAEIRDATLQTSSSGVAVVLVVADFDGATTVDASGQVVTQHPDTKPQARLWYLALQDDGGWLVREIEQLGTLEEVRE